MSGSLIELKHRRKDKSSSRLLLRRQQKRFLADRHDRTTSGSISPQIQQLLTRNGETTTNVPSPFGCQKRTVRREPSEENRFTTKSNCSRTKTVRKVATTNGMASETDVAIAEIETSDVKKIFNPSKCTFGGHRLRSTRTGSTRHRI